MNSILEQFTTHDFNLSNPTQEEIKELARKIRDAEDISGDTRETYYKTLKKFYNTYENGEYSELTDCFSVSGSNGQVEKHMILSQSEISQIINQTNNIRNKAFFRLMYEVAATPGELLQAKLQDIDKAVEEYDCQKIESEKHRDYYAGIDCGRVRDSSVISIVSKDRSSQLMVEHIKSFKETPAREVLSYLSYLNDKFDLEVAVSEYVGLGIEPTERIEEETDIDVERFETTVDKKLEAYEQLRNTFEQEEIVIPNHRKLVIELKMLRYESTRHGNIKIHHPEGGKDDHADALCFAIKAAKKDRSRDRAVLLFPE